MIHSYGAMQEIFKFLKSLEVLFFQAINCFMYRAGVSWCQEIIKFPHYIIFTFEYYNSLFMVSDDDNLVCRKIRCTGFDLMDTKTI